METIGIKELKTRLSSYVHQVEQGTHFIITDRGRAVAELVPLSPDRRGALALQAAGKSQWSGGKPEGLRGVEVRGKPISDTVIEDRR